MKNIDEKTGLYGQFNQTVEKCKDLLMKNDDLIKFLYYANNSEFDIRKAEFKVNKEIKETTRKEHLLDYNSLEDREAHAYVIIDVGTINREQGYSLSVERDYIQFRALAYICCHDSLLHTNNGDRIRAIEQCIQDTCTNAEIVNTFHCSVGSSTVVSVAEGYKCRVVPILFSYLNTSTHGNNKF